MLILVKMVCADLYFDMIKSSPRSLTAASSGMIDINATGAHGHVYAMPKRFPHFLTPSLPAAGLYYMVDIGELETTLFATGLR